MKEPKWVETEGGWYMVVLGSILGALAAVCVIASLGMAIGGVCCW